MSERSSFCTEYIYCQECFAAAKTVLSGDSKYLCAGPLKSWHPDDDSLPIIAGKHGGLGEYDDRASFHLLMMELRDKICHPVQVAFLPDGSPGRLYFLVPKEPISVMDGDLKVTPRYALNEESIKAGWQEYADSWRDLLKR